MKLDELHPLFVAESCQLLQQMEKSLLILQQAPHNEIAIHTAFRVVHTIKGSAAVLGLKNIELFSGRVEKLMDKLRDGLLLADSRLISLLEAACSQLAVLIESIATLEHVSTGVLRRGQELSDDLESYLQPSPVTHSSNILSFVRPRNKVDL